MYKKYKKKKGLKKEKERETSRMNKVPMIDKFFLLKIGGRKYIALQEQVQESEKKKLR
jgi:hypothetical protein